MTLKVDIIAHIRAHGPMPLSAYMARCNEHYYATRIPFGRDGDFITAPDISQAFGELIGLWAADLWQRAGAPARFNLIELGPGRGTLMQDALRATEKVPGFHAALAVHFVETSSRLRAEQEKRVPQAIWHDDLNSMGDSAPWIVIANEFFDALPVDQLVNGVLRSVTEQDGELTWSIEPDPWTEEIHGAGCRIMRHLAGQLHRTGGAALVIDYGGEKLQGDSLQAVRRHHYASVLDAPGENDLTTHVDFDRLKREAQQSDCRVHGPVTQGAFLRALGLDLRTAQIARAHPLRSDEIVAASARLADPDQMGELFKVMCITSVTWPHPAGFP